MGGFSGRKTCMMGLHALCHEDRQCDSSITAITHLSNYYHSSIQAPPDTLSLEKAYVYGKPGSFSGGVHTLAVSLERSSLFNLSGIPINNSRVLALRGQFSSDPSEISTSSRVNIYLKYVKLARIFLNNVEVEQ